MQKKEEKKLELISNIYINKQFDIDKELVKGLDTKLYRNILKEMIV